MVRYTVAPTGQNNRLLIAFVVDILTELAASKASTDYGGPGRNHC